MKKMLLMVLVSGLSLFGSAQEFGGNAFSTRWRQLNSDTARVIFPRGLDTTAQRVADVIHNVAAKNLFPLGSRLNKINIVLQPQTIVSNGYVGLGPFRSEFYLTPPADNFSLGTISWIDQLALHEYRHVQQYNNFNHGASKVMRQLFGEEGYALAINAAVPNWFYEGDAVFQETVLSPQGRGRLPSFLKAYPALWQAGKNYKWMKLRNGSYRDYVPNHYEMGYLMVNYGYEKYGVDFWRKVTADASGFRGAFYPMQKAVKKYSGLPYRDFTRQAFDYYKNGYNDVLNTTRQAPRGRKPFTSYFYPQQVSRDSVVYLRSSYDERPAFYIRDSAGERRLRFADISIDRQFSYRNGKIVYAAFESHPRWQWHNYSVIKILDVKTNVQRSLFGKTKYFLPDISEDGKRIVANHVSINGKSSLIILNSETGLKIQEIAADSISYFSNPKFLTPAKIVAGIRLQDGKSFVGLVDLNANSVKALTPPSFNAVGHINVMNNRVYFTASQGLRDDIFFVDAATGVLNRLKNSTFANYFPDAGFGKINYSAFTAYGYKLQQLPETNAVWERVNAGDFVNTASGIVSAKRNNSTAFLDSIPDRKFQEKKYAKLTHPFNFHSWRPNYNDPVFSFTVYGDNILNTLGTQLLYEYNQNDRTHMVGAGMLYGGLFPYVSAGTKFTWDRHANIGSKLKQWNQWENYVGVNIPLNWVSNRTSKYFNWGATYFHRSDFNTGIYADTFRTLKFGYLYHQLTWSQQVQRARLDVFPRWGYDLNIQYRHAVNFYRAWQTYLKMNLFAPGLFPTHSFYTTLAFQNAGTKDRVFSNRFPFARGYYAVDSAKLGGVAFNYHLPVAYPDWGFANIFYLQRLRAGIFFDYTRVFGKATPYKRELTSTGAELFFDTKWWNQHLISLGMRTSFLLRPDPLTKKKNVFLEFILPVTLIPR